MNIVKIISDLLLSSAHSIKAKPDSRIRKYLFILFFTALWTSIGVLSGFVAGFLVFFLSPDNGWPVAIAFAICALSGLIYGLRFAWLLLSSMNAD